MQLCWESRIVSNESVLPVELAFSSQLKIRNSKFFPLPSVVCPLSSNPRLTFSPRPRIASLCLVSSA